MVSVRSQREPGERDESDDFNGARDEARGRAHFSKSEESQA
jgi:hypothetical protein